MAIPEHFFSGIDCQRLYVTDDGTVWLDWADADSDEGGDDSWVVHARLDGVSWTEFRMPEVDPPVLGRGLGSRGVGG